MLAQQIAETTKVLQGADAISTSIDALNITLPPNLVTTRDGARATVGRARERIGQAEKTENTTTGAEAVRLAHEASDEFTKVLDQAKKLEREESGQRLQQALAAATEQFSFVESSLATLERLVAEKPSTITPEMSSQREAIVKEYGTLKRRFENAKRNENVNGVQDTTKLAVEARTRIDALLQMFGPASLRDRGVNEALEQGARHYLAGEVPAGAQFARANHVQERRDATGAHTPVPCCVALHALHAFGRKGSGAAKQRVGCGSAL